MQKPKKAVKKTNNKIQTNNYSAIILILGTNFLLIYQCFLSQFW